MKMRALNWLLTFAVAFARGPDPCPCRLAHQGCRLAAGGRDNQLIGYGLVVGLQGTGDSLRSSPFTDQSIRAMLQNLGISTQGGQSRTRNVAAVLVTATLAPFASPGSRLDVTVGSLGDADVAARRYAGHDLAFRRRRADLRCGAGLRRRQRLQRSRGSR